VGVGDAVTILLIVLTPLVAVRRRSNTYLGEARAKAVVGAAQLQDELLHGRESSNVAKAGLDGAQGQNYRGSIRRHHLGRQSAPAEVVRVVRNGVRRLPHMR